MSDVFINGQVDPYRENPILSTTFESTNPHQREQAYLRHFFRLAVGKKEQSLEETFLDCVHFTNVVSHISACAHNCDLLLKPGRDIDHIKCEFDFRSRRSFWSGTHFQEFVRPGRIEVSWL